MCYRIVVSERVRWWMQEKDRYLAAIPTRSSSSDMKLGPSPHNAVTSQAPTKNAPKLERDMSSSCENLCTSSPSSDRQPGRTAFLKQANLDTREERVLYHFLRRRTRRKMIPGDSEEQATSRMYNQVTIDWVCWICDRPKDSLSLRLFGWISIS